MKAYLINLDRSPGRLAEADAQLRAAGIRARFRRVPCLGHRRRNAVTPPLLFDFYSRTAL